MKVQEGRVIVEKNSIGQTHVRPIDRSARAQQDLWMYLGVRLGFKIGYGPVDADDSRFFVVQKDRVEGGETRFSTHLRPNKK